MALNIFLYVNLPYGTYNITNEGPFVSWAEIVKLYLKKSGKPAYRRTINSTAECFSDKPDSAKRPLNSILNLTKIEKNWILHRKIGEIKLSKLFN